jgi:tetratricopeptide (TPR) repeat protein
MSSTVQSKAQAKLTEANRLGINLWIAGKYEAALAHFEAVRFLFDETEPGYFRSFLINIGIVYQELGFNESAIGHYMKAIELPATTEIEHLDINLAIGNLANALLFLDRPDEAQAFLSQAEEYFTRICDGEHLGEVLETKARIQRAQGNHGLAVKTARQAVNTMFEYSEDSNAIGRAIRTLAMCWRSTPTGASLGESTRRGFDEG